MVFITPISSHINVSSLPINDFSLLSIGFHKEWNFESIYIILKPYGPHNHLWIEHAINVGLISLISIGNTPIDCVPSIINKGLGLFTSYIILSNVFDILIKSIIEPSHQWTLGNDIIAILELLHISDIIKSVQLISLFNELISFVIIFKLEPVALHAICHGITTEPISFSKINISFPCFNIFNLIQLVLHNDIAEDVQLLIAISLESAPIKFAYCSLLK